MGNFLPVEQWRHRRWKDLMKVVAGAYLMDGFRKTRAKQRLR